MLDSSSRDALSYERTWHRAKTHRNAVAEVFVTDAVVGTDGRVRAAAQTPPCHSFYGDHSPRPASADPLLLMEVCRQAGLVTAYELGVAMDTILATGEWDLRVND
ncbi:MAG: AfsA-related hotdog domain-containing protein [Schaalia sp.]